jgi:hypothetical protein
MHAQCTGLQSHTRFGGAVSACRQDAISYSECLPRISWSKATHTLSIYLYVTSRSVVHNTQYARHLASIATTIARTPSQQPPSLCRRLLNELDTESTQEVVRTECLRDNSILLCSHRKYVTRHVAILLSSVCSSYYIYLTLLYLTLLFLTLLYLTSL